MPDAAPVTTAVRPASENAAATTGSSDASCSFAASSRSFEIRSIVPDDSAASAAHGRVDAVTAGLELGHDLLGQQLERAHHLVVGQVAELHVAEELIDPDRLVAQDL